MIQLIIESIDGYIYHVVDKNNKYYTLNLEFYDIEVFPNTNDYFLMSEELLKEEKALSFGALNSSYGRKIETSSDKDLFILVIQNQPYYLKRLYG